VTCDLSPVFAGAKLQHSSGAHNPTKTAYSAIGEEGKIPKTGERATQFEPVHTHYYI